MRGINPARRIGKKIKNSVTNLDELFISLIIAEGAWSTGQESA
jgi:hypothetical protein